MKKQQQQLIQTSNRNVSLKSEGLWALDDSLTLVFGGAVSPLGVGCWLSVSVLSKLFREMLLTSFVGCVHTPEVLHS